MSPLAKSTLVVGFLCLASANLHTADKGEKLHVLLVLDTKAKGGKDGIGPSVQKDEERVTAFFRANIPAERLALTVLNGDDITPAKIEQHYARVPKGERVVFYFSGHGGTDPNFGHVLGTKQQGLKRSTLVKWINAREPKLTVILTDCCATATAAPQARPNPPVAVPVVGPDVRQAVFGKLFFESKGVVDWNACSVGETAVGYVDLGGAFTHAFLQSCDAAASANDLVTWDRLFPQVVSGTNAKNPLQTPAVMGGGIEGVRERGIRVATLEAPFGADIDPNTLVFRKITPDNPLAKAGIREGDRLLTVNGQRLTYRQWMDSRKGPSASRVETVVVAEQCGCGCGKFHVNCGPACRWDREPKATRCVKE